MKDSETFETLNNFTFPVQQNHVSQRTDNRIPKTTTMTMDDMYVSGPNTGCKENLTDTHIKPFQGHSSHFNRKSANTSPKVSANTSPKVSANTSPKAANSSFANKRRSISSFSSSDSGQSPFSYSPSLNSPFLESELSNQFHHLNLGNNRRQSVDRHAQHHIQHNPSNYHTNTSNLHPFNSHDYFNTSKQLVNHLHSNDNTNYRMTFPVGSNNHQSNFLLPSPISRFGSKEKNSNFHSNSNSNSNSKDETMMSTAPQSPISRRRGSTKDWNHASCKNESPKTDASRLRNSSIMSGKKIKHRRSLSISTSISQDLDDNLPNSLSTPGSDSAYKLPSLIDSDCENEDQISLVEEREAEDEKAPAENCIESSPITPRDFEDRRTSIVRKPLQNSSSKILENSLETGTVTPLDTPSICYVVTPPTYKEVDLNVLDTH